jgi:hypothetical protein
MPLTPARPDLAYINATRLDQSVLVKELRDLLGAKLVAYLGGVKETRAVRQWAEGARQVSGAEDLRRLRLLVRMSPLIVAIWCVRRLRPSRVAGRVRARAVGVDPFGQYADDGRFTVVQDPDPGQRRTQGTDRDAGRRDGLGQEPADLLATGAGISVLVARQRLLGFRGVTGVGYALPDTAARKGPDTGRPVSVDPANVNPTCLQGARRTLWA